MMNTELLIKLSPLVVATVHGYAAAWLAVKMLFRPRQPYFIQGWQVPLTPGMLPKERERFIAALSKAIGEKLLNIEVISQELAKLNLQSEISALAQREYANFTGNETALNAITDQLRERLAGFSQSHENKQAITEKLQAIIDRETTDAGFFRRLAAGYLMDEATLYKLVEKALEALAAHAPDSPQVRVAVRDALQQLPQKLLSGNTSLVSQGAITSLVTTLSQKLDIRQIMTERLNAFSNEDIENLVMDTAGREINAIVWFGAAAGLIVGVIQTLINFIP